MDLDMKQLAVAIRTIAEEKNLPEDAVKEVVEQALAAAYRRDYGDREQDIRVSMNLNTGDVDAYVTKEIVDTVENEAFEISLADAQVRRKNAKVGETIEIHEKAQEFGRVAAQTAKQVILQRLREAEREIVLNEYEDKIGTVINATVARVEGNIVRIDLGIAAVAGVHVVAPVFGVTTNNLNTHDIYTDTQSVASEGESLPAPADLPKQLGGGLLMASLGSGIASFAKKRM